MPIKTFQPTTASNRFAAVPAFEEITRSQPERSLLKAFKFRAGRNSAGRITVRHRGGRHRRLFRVIDFKREKLNIPAKVVAIEYDPNRSARIALLHYADGEKRYILAPVGLSTGAVLVAGPEAEPSIGNVLRLERIPLGVPIHNVELQPGRGAQLARGAGQAATVMSREGLYANVKLPSGEVRRLHVNCRATIGQVGNVDHASVKYGKAGRARWRGIRPTVRGRAMNPVDHPLGGGEGKSTGGHPRSPWGQYAKGKKTRRPHRKSERFIIARRK
ncbi:MAG: 50S ribosomal protein L2 [Lentisphaerae bacterium]|nr:50S ribosomal protein L2 [Lentisphaerota bacterium]